MGLHIKSHTFSSYQIGIIVPTSSYCFLGFLGVSSSFSSHRFLGSRHHLEECPGFDSILSRGGYNPVVQDLGRVEGLGSLVPIMPSSTSTRKV